MFFRDTEKAGKKNHSNASLRSINNNRFNGVGRLKSIVIIIFSVDLQKPIIKKDAGLTRPLVKLWDEKTSRRIQYIMRREVLEYLTAK